MLTLFFDGFFGRSLCLILELLMLKAFDGYNYV